MGEGSKKVIFLSHCFINQNAKVLEFARYPGVVAPFLDFMKRKGYAVEQLPCPETLHMGIKRWWNTKELYDTPGFRKHCRRLAKHVVDLMEHYQRKGYDVVLIGLDGSPSCGVNITGRNPNWGGRPYASIEDYHIVEEMGVWMEELKAEIERRGVKLANMTGVPMDDPKFNMDESLRNIEKLVEG